MPLSTGDKYATADTEVETPGAADRFWINRARAREAGEPSEALFTELNAVLSSTSPDVAAADWHNFNLLAEEGGPILADATIVSVTYEWRARVNNSTGGLDDFRGEFQAKAMRTSTAQVGATQLITPAARTSSGWVTRTVDLPGTVESPQSALTRADLANGGIRCRCDGRWLSGVVGSGQLNCAWVRVIVAWVLYKDGAGGGKNSVKAAGVATSLITPRGGGKSPTKAGGSPKAQVSRGTTGSNVIAKAGGPAKTLVTRFGGALAAVKSGAVAEQVATLRPDADTATIEWTPTPSGAHFSTVDDAVTQPTTPDIADFVSTTVQNNVTRLELGTVSVESVSSAKLWAYVANDATADGGDWFATLRKADATVIATIRVNENTTGQWLSATFTGALSQAEVDGLQINLASGTNLTPAQIRTCYAVYVELTYVAAGVTVFVTPRGGGKTVASAAEIGSTQLVTPRGGGKAAGKAGGSPKVQVSLSATGGKAGAKSGAVFTIQATQAGGARAAASAGDAGSTQLVTAAGGARSPPKAGAGVSTVVSYAIAGYSRDGNTDAVIAAVRADIYRTSNHQHMGRVTSDAVGYYSLAIPFTGNETATFWVRFFKAGTPNRFATTDEDLTLFSTIVQSA